MADEALYLPALRCRMGDWIYYVTCLPFHEIASRVRPADELHTSESLNQLIQRELTDRSKKIANYLLSQDQHFFNSIVIGVYGGNPEWLDIRLLSTKHLAIEELSDETIENITHTLGMLRLTGQEKLFAMDGQHRVEAIKQAIDLQKSLRNEEISAIFVGHDRSPDGLKRTRRLFSTLNKYAKPVSKGEIIALDEDDGFAIVTRRLVDEHPLFKGKRSSSQKSQTRILRSDKQSFTSILTIYDVCSVLMLKSRPHWTKSFLTQITPDEEIVNTIYEECSEFWNALADSFPMVREVVDGEPEEQIAGKYRTERGGHLLFRPIGQMAFARAVKMLKDREKEQGREIGIKDAVSRLASIPCELSASPWPRVLWNPVNNTMLTSMTQRDLAAKLMLYFSGYEMNESELHDEYRSVTGDPAAELPKI